MLGKLSNSWGFISRNILETGYQPPVWPQSHFFHDILEGDQVFDVKIRLIAEVLSGRIKVDVKA